MELAYLNEEFDLNDPDLTGCLDELPLWSAPFGLKLLDRLVMKPANTILDIGFGTGFPLVEVAMRAGQSCRVYGIDRWKTGAERVKKKMDVYGLKNIELFVQPAESIPLPDCSVDVIVSNNGLNNVQDMKTTLAEASRVIKPGGQMLLTINLDKTMIEFYDMFELILREMNMNDAVEDMRKHIYLKRKPLNYILTKIEQAGFEIRKIEHDRFNWHFLDGTAMLNHFTIKLAFLQSWKAIIPKSKQQDFFFALEDRLNKRSEHSGLKLTIPFVTLDCRKNN